MNKTDLSVGFFLGRPGRSAELARRLRQRGFDVTHYAAEPVGEQPIVRTSPRVVPAFARVLRTEHDVYFTGLSHVPSLCLWANRRLRGLPYVFNATGAKWQMFHDRSKNRVFPGLFERHVHPFLLDRTYEGASRIVCNSRFLERQIAERHPELVDRLLTIYNGIDFDRYACKRRRTSSRDLNLLFVTTLNYRNKSDGLRLVCDAFRELRAREPRAKLVVAAKTSDAAYREFARQCVEWKGIGEATRLLFNAANVPDLLADADLFVYATPESSNDSLPRALLEAQAAGVPAVTTATSGCPEIVADGATGLVVPYEPVALAEGVLALAGDPRRRTAMSEAARERTRTIFSWERMADAYAETFHDIAAERIPAPEERKKPPSGTQKDSRPFASIRG